MVLCLVCGVGLGLAIVFANGTIHYLQSRPKAWDRKSIRATLVDAVPVSEIDLSAGLVPNSSDSSTSDIFDKVAAKPDARHNNKTSDPYYSIEKPVKIETLNSGVSFSVDLQNTTDADVTIPKNLVIMQATRGTHTLHDSLLLLESDYFIPAGHTVLITLKNDGFCAAHEEPHQCFDDNFKDDEEIVLFDQSRKFEIHITIPPIRIPKNQAMYLSGKPEKTVNH
jgi:hypothetical protein